MFRSQMACFSFLRVDRGSVVGPVLVGRALLARTRTLLWLLSLAVAVSFFVNCAFADLDQASKSLPLVEVPAKLRLPLIEEVEENVPQLHSNLPEEVDLPSDGGTVVLLSTLVHPDAFPQSQIADSEDRPSQKFSGRADLFLHHIFSGSSSAHACVGLVAMPEGDDDLTIEATMSVAATKNDSGYAHAGYRLGHRRTEVRRVDETSGGCGFSGEFDGPGSCAAALALRGDAGSQAPFFHANPATLENGNPAVIATMPVSLAGGVNPLTWHAKLDISGETRFVLWAKQVDSRDACNASAWDLVGDGGQAPADAVARLVAGEWPGAAADRHTSAPSLIARNGVSDSDDWIPSVKLSRVAGIVAWSDLSLRLATDSEDDELRLSDVVGGLGFPVNTTSSLHFCPLIRDGVAPGWSTDNASFQYPRECPSVHAASLLAPSPDDGKVPDLLGPDDGDLLRARFPGSSSRSQGNYGAKITIETEIVNDSEEPQIVRIALHTPPIDGDRQYNVTSDARFEPQQTSFIGVVETCEERSRASTTCAHHFVRILQAPRELPAFYEGTLEPEETRKLTIRLVYPADASPPQLLTVQATPANAALP